MQLPLIMRKLQTLHVLLLWYYISVICLDKNISSALHVIFRNKKHDETWPKWHQCHQVWCIIASWEKYIYWEIPKERTKVWGIPAVCKIPSDNQGSCVVHGTSDYIMIHQLIQVATQQQCHNNNVCHEKNVNVDVTF